ncbi:kinase-like domain-containing protein [Mycena floridula]|nr:kinase-like domain-containing protein [Mycena floridula]
MSFALPCSLELVVVVKNFLEYVSGEANISRETVDAVSTVTEACFFGSQSISVHEFVQQATSSLKDYPNLARKLNAFLNVSGEQLELVLNDLSIVELIVIHGPAGGQIYPLSDTIPVPVISNTTTLRALLRKDTIEPHFTNATCSSSWARAIAELLQDELASLNHPSLDNAHKTKCLQHLRRLALRKGILPPSFFLPQVMYDGSRPACGSGFADAYKGKLNGEVVCLKVLRFFTESPEMTQKLLIDCCREALVWKQLDHPNVLPFLGVNVELFAPSFCLVSPWMSNGNLRQFLHRNPNFDRRNAITDIAAAMQYLHEYSPPIVHADIRCANVLVQDDLRCCLADFGLSSISASFSLTSSSSGNTNGSIRWMAPELFLTSRDGNELKSTSRDIYAFACTILEVYTGEHPFAQHKHDPQVMCDVLDGGRPPRPTNISDNLWALVEACWHQRPTSRPDARTVVNSLQTGLVNFTPTLPQAQASSIPLFARCPSEPNWVKQKHHLDLDKELAPISTDVVLDNDQVPPSHNSEIESPTLTFQDSTPITPEIPLITERGNSLSGHNEPIIPPEEDMRRLLQEREIGQENSSVPARDFLILKPKDLDELTAGGWARVLGQYQYSQELVCAQVEWATAGADQSRGLKRRESSKGNPSSNAERDAAVESTFEKKLLAALLSANTEIFERSEGIMSILSMSDRRAP